MYFVVRIAFLYYTFFPRKVNFMQILTLNAGSSSLKTRLFCMKTEKILFEQNRERVTSPETTLDAVLGTLQAKHIKVDAIGHRVAHGGSRFKEPVRLTPEVIEDIETCTPLAPLHNPPALAAIGSAMQLWPDIPHIAVFDTAFHATLPEAAFHYGVPESWYTAGVRRYGFHGTSHQYIAETLAICLKRNDLRIISCHLGNGASICAIDKGKSIDNSMGMTSLEGLVMGTRPGDMDAGIFNYIHQQLGLSISEIEHALYHDSGLLGLSCTSNDLRDITKQADMGNSKAKLAIAVYVYRIKKTIGAYTAIMNGLDAVAFTAGIGENSALIRSLVCKNMDYLGIELDEALNNGLMLKNEDAVNIALPTSRAAIYAVKTQEELMIARACHTLCT